MGAYRSGVPTVVTRSLLTPEEAAQVLQPRDDVVLEEVRTPGTFGLIEGPFTAWERVVVTHETDAGVEVEQTVRFRSAMPGLRRMFAPAIRKEAGRLPVGDHPWPWWAPPERQNARVAQLIALLCGLALVAGYGAGVTTQTMTFAVDDFGMSDAAQGNALAAVRIGVLASLGLLVIADRRGRRNLVVFVSYAACLTTAAGAVVPNLYLLAGTQTLTRGLVTTASVLLVVVAAEEVGARSRAFAVSVLAMSGGAGAMLAVVLLPIADIAAWSWRL
ncbi:MAG: MFS transporter, partial [Actinobacteria bacterium]|nr:MFS transporter [Actinomycetota bacterium]NIT96053.1 MFS transporter [Actinomycetota bacterium]NIV56220.1 hypothetical protein [Actinomycetota bacterium]NIX51037.1 hypothetical protein [Actinomycetota bacterium]